MSFVDISLAVEKQVAKAADEPEPSYLVTPGSKFHTIISRTYF